MEFKNIDEARGYYIEKHLNKVGGGYWYVLEQYLNGEFKIYWGKGERGYIKILKIPHKEFERLSK